MGVPVAKWGEDARPGRMRVRTLDDQAVTDPEEVHDGVGPVVGAGPVVVVDGDEVALGDDALGEL
ncbi:hypothetical protein HLK59_09575 [Streptomyces sp. S3(2020)]|uniref:hypothetical protein n=1 Tax=Streptomyces sp. S3(2020) TaxID=2732044 RepID=UPI001487A506|nr:hypothetical protein [Streptomyces sp. S3(2020)]